MNIFILDIVQRDSNISILSKHSYFYPLTNRMQNNCVFCNAKISKPIWVAFNLCWYLSRMHMWDGKSNNSSINNTKIHGALSCENWEKSIELEKYFADHLNKVMFFSICVILLIYLPWIFSIISIFAPFIQWTINKWWSCFGIWKKFHHQESN